MEGLVMKFKEGTKEEMAPDLAMCKKIFAWYNKCYDAAVEKKSYKREMGKEATAIMAEFPGNKLCERMVDVLQIDIGEISNGTRTILHRSDRAHIFNEFWSFLKTYYHYDGSDSFWRSFIYETHHITANIITEQVMADLFACIISYIEARTQTEKTVA